MSLPFQLDSFIVRYLAHFRGYYPGILEWYSGLEEEFASGRRQQFVSWNGADVQGLAITKNGDRAKLCHISVSPTARDQGLGRTLMQLALWGMVYRGAQEIRVTTGEEVFREHGAFFRAAGFEVIDWQVHRYRHGVSELLWRLKVEPHLFSLEHASLEESPQFLKHRVLGNVSKSES
ncbi:MAG: GNAT family N-acetyltransferase [Candidatus Binatia bacterium]